MGATRVLLVDDHEVVRVGLRTVLGMETDLDVVGEASSGEQAVELAERLRPEVVLMDVRMEGMDGIETCRVVREVSPATRVIMLTSFADEEAVFAAILAGAAGYLLKNTGRAELLRAVRAVARGEALLDPAVTRSVTDRLVRLAARSRADEIPLSEREKEVLVLVAQGMTNKEIAAQLIVSEKTARNHVSHILEKLGFSRRSEAAAYAVKSGLLSDRRR